jgi:hypothetical protein
MRHQRADIGSVNVAITPGEDGSALRPYLTRHVHCQIQRVSPFANLPGIILRAHGLMEYQRWNVLTVRHLASLP